MVVAVGSSGAGALSRRASFADLSVTGTQQATAELARMSTELSSLVSAFRL